MNVEKPETTVEVGENLIHFIARSPSVFHAVHGVKEALLYSGFTEIREEDPWHIEKGRKYVVTRNGSALIAFTVPKEGAHSFHIMASHADSPCFKIKENPEIKEGPYVKLNVEGYGGMIMSTWLDRPLSVAGRLIVRENGHIAQKLAAVDGTMLVIPSVAIHMDRNVNHKKDWNVQKDLLPLYGLSTEKTSFMDVIAASAKKQLKQLTELGFDKLPICMAKTQFSFSDDASKLGAPRGFKITVRDLKVNAGAGFLVAKTGDIMTMPGLPKRPASEGIGLADDGTITGLS